MEDEEDEDDDEESWMTILSLGLGGSVGSLGGNLLGDILELEIVFLYWG